MVDLNDPLGVDVAIIMPSTDPNTWDMDPARGLVSGVDCVVQCAFRRMITDHASVPMWSDFGAGLSEQEGASHGLASLQRFESELKRQLLLDERVEEVIVDVTFETDTGTLSGDVVIIVSGGNSFSTTFTVDRYEGVRIGTR